MKSISTTAFIISWMIPAFWEVALLLDNPWNLINPFLQFRVLWLTITSPVYWGFLIIGLVFAHLDSKRKHKVDHNI